MGGDFCTCLLLHLPPRLPAYLPACPPYTLCFGSLGRLQTTDYRGGGMKGKQRERATASCKQE